MFQKPKDQYKTIEQSVELLSKQNDEMEKGETSNQSIITTIKNNDKKPKEEVSKKRLTFVELVKVLSPYFWPAKGSDGAFINRIRSTSTWVMVALSKICNLWAPFFLSKATNYLVQGDFTSAAQTMSGFIAFRLAGSIFKELQSLIYIKVKQQAGIQLQELTFTHLHSLSLNWHLSKKTGSIMKAMDRGTEAASQLISYLFLFLLPAIIECLAVIILFFAQYRQVTLGSVVLIGVTIYALATVAITQWRKKFREQTNKYDNDFHDRATDSIINYETVKYFTGEAFEIERFVSSVIKYQKFTSSTQLSLNVLNITQQFVLNITLLVTMLISGLAVTKGEMTLGGKSS